MFRILFGILGLLLIFSYQPIYAQGGVKKLIEDAEIYYNKENFNAAKASLETAVNTNSKFASAWRMLGSVNSKLGDYEEATTAFEQLFSVAPDYSLLAYYECADAYMKQYMYAEALDYFLLYKHADPKDYKTDEQTPMLYYDGWVNQQIRNCEFALKVDFMEAVEDAENLGLVINSPADEYLPTLTADGELLVYTKDKSHEDILVSKQKNKDGEWNTSRSIGNAINTPLLNEGMAKLTTCGREIYFTACGWENGTGGCDIFHAKFDKKNGNVENIEIAKGLNSEGWESQPSISCDGKTMYFTSNREGGYGGTDIWMSEWNETQGYWSPPQNLGPIINTPADEEAPYISPDGITMYFTSNGHPGFGDSDIFRVEKLDEAHGNWTIPVNMGRAINTPFREAGLSLTPDGETAYFASARPEGFGGLDIYKALLYRDIAPLHDMILIEGLVYDIQTGEPIENAQVKFGKTGEDKKLYQTDDEGRFFVCAMNEGTFGYIVSKGGYDTYVDANIFKRPEDAPTNLVEIPLASVADTAPVEEMPTASAPVVPKPKTRKNLSVYYESGKYDLTDIQRSQVEKLVTQFENKEELNIRVTGYADDVGNKDFNISLSEKRAGFVAQYIEELGVPKDQITYEGKGIVDSNVAKHQKRRVEIIILN